MSDKGPSNDVPDESAASGSDADAGGSGAPVSDEGTTVFGDRYELHRKLARGGMADVYLGNDRLLDRPVAVKVLFPEHSRDPNFVERFRREAQNAANLNQPNIVGIYDWGEHDGTYYIVMEYVEGRTLSEILRAEGPLHPDRAAEIAIDIAAALSFAHRNGVIHRDVKPGNVLLTQGGQVKVADFGIAQAIARPDHDLTQAGAVMGTAAYFSPEQAQGHTLDPRSDVYSLGCVLFEMLTGRPPFTGDTPVAIAYKHVQEQPPTPSGLNGDVPPELDAITLRLLAKEPANRYPSADDARSDLRRFRSGQPVLAVLSTGAVLGDASELEPLPLEEGEVVEKRHVGALMFSLGALVLILGGLLTLLVDELQGNGVDIASEIVPDVLNLEVGEARDLLSDAGFVPFTQFEENDDVPENVVFDQNPPPGTEIEQGTKIILRVSSGSSTVPVDEVVGLQSTAARALLESNGFIVEEIEEFHEVAALGEVVAQDPPPRAEVPMGSQVVITISLGPEPIEIPDLVDKSEIEAANALGNLGFEVAFFEEESADVDEGNVVRTDPPAGELLAPGGIVTVIISIGKFIQVPAVVGMDANQAIEQLRVNELQPSIETQPLPAGHPDNGKVIAQLPEPGTEVDKGSIVIIRVGVSVAPTTTTTAPTTTTVAPTTTTAPPTTTTTTTTTTAPP